MLDNIDIAILNKLNLLAERYDLKPYDFIATLELRNGNAILSSSGVNLALKLPYQTDALKSDRFGQMLDTLGASSDGVIHAKPSRIVDTIDTAMSVAPRSRIR